MKLKPTPIEFVADGGVWVKRDDLFLAPGGAPGGKARTCYALAKDAENGLVTAGSRSSPQVNIVAQIGKALGLPVRVHTPRGKPGPEVEAAMAAGAVRIEHRAGYNTVIAARAREDALERDWTEIPFGMECEEAVEQTATQVVDLPEGVKRIVVPVGSGMTLAGILTGLLDCEVEDWLGPVVGVCVGADPVRRLDRYCPLWHLFKDVSLVRSESAYDEPVTDARIGDLLLDPFYEAKCLPFLEPGDLFWVVGIRQTALARVAA